MSGVQGGFAAFRSRPETPILEFHGLTLDLERGQLRRGDQELALRPKSFDVLTYFAAHPGRLISKFELLRELWPGVTVSDDSLVQCLVDIRRVLGPDEHLIRTVRGRGYRFEATVTSPPRPRAEGAPVAVTALSGAPEPTPHAASRRAQQASDGHWPRHPALLLALVVIVTAVAAWSLRPNLQPGSAGSSDVPTALSSTGLGTTHINAAAEAEVVAGRTEAADHTRTGLLRGIVRFERALELAPDYAEASSELSQALTMLHIFGVAEPASVLPRAREAASQAIALDPTMASAYSAMAHVQEQWDRDWAGAETSHRRALALNPESALFHVRYALFLVTQSRYDEAIAMSDRAIALAPGFPQAHATRAVIEIMAGHPDRALAATERAYALNPTFSLTLFWQAVALMELGRLDEALRAAIGSGVEPSNEPTLLVGVVHARAGRRADALTVRSALEAKASVSYVPATEFAVLDAALGDVESALDWLERGFDERARWMAAVAHTPLLRSLRGHPRFTRLVERLGLPSPPPAT
jgi:DNA-binding winged helix-turn-helix (wHTH) protein/Tfp pilus assembly protein PilF